MKKINEKYAEIMRQADNAVGRKEVVSLLKKAAMIISKSCLINLKNTRY